MSKVNEKEVNRVSRNDIPKWFFIIAGALSLAAIVIFLITLYFTPRQTVDNSDAHTNAELIENQPIFQVKYTSKEILMSSSIDTDVLTIHNVGRVVKKITIKNDVFLGCKVSNVHLEEYKNLEGQVLFFPLDNYLETNPEIKSLSGNILTDSIQDNVKQMIRGVRDIENLPVGLDLHYFGLYKFVIIDYVDIYDNSHSLFYLNGDQVYKDSYDLVNPKTERRALDVQDMSGSFLRNFMKR